MWWKILELALLRLPDVVDVIRRGLEDHHDESTKKKIERILPPKSANE